MRRGEGRSDAKSPEYYSGLPDLMDPHELREEFRALLATPAVATPAVDGNHGAMAQALSELGDRQWHTFELLASDLRDGVSRRVVEIWSDSDLEQAERCIAIIAHLGLGDALRSLASLPPESMHPDVRSSLADAVAELGDSVDDPWSGLRRA